MDLRTIKNRIRDGQIGTIDEFERDVVLMFTNAMLYNEKGSDVHRMAEEVSRFAFMLVLLSNLPAG
jgi:bromodomain-containing protein 8